MANEEYMQYMDEALALRDNLAAATGYDKTQQGCAIRAKVRKGVALRPLRIPGHETGGHVHRRFSSLLPHRLCYRWGKKGRILLVVTVMMDTGEVCYP